MQFKEKSYWYSSPVKNYGSVLYLMPAGNSSQFTGPFIKSFGLRHFVVDGKAVEPPRDESLRLFYDYEPGRVSASFNNFVCPFIEFDLELTAAGSESFLLRYTFHNKAYEDKNITLVFDAMADRELKTKQFSQSRAVFGFDLAKRRQKHGEGTVDFNFLREWFIKNEDFQASISFQSGEFSDVQEVRLINGSSDVLSDGVELTSELSIPAGSWGDFEIRLDFGCSQGEDENAVKKIWADFAAKLPLPGMESPRHQLAYYKSWNVLFFNEVKTPDLHWCLTGLSFPSMWLWDTSPFIIDAYINTDPAFAQNLIQAQLGSIKETGMMPLHVIMGLEDRKQRKDEITQIPLLANSAWQVFEITSDMDFAGSAYKTLLKNYNWYQDQRRPDNKIPLWGIDDKRAPYHYGPESGMDNCPVYADGPAYSAAINSAKWSFEKAMANFASALGLERETAKWKSYADETRDFMLENMWDEDDSYLYATNYDLEKIKIKTSDIYPALYLYLLPDDKIRSVSKVLEKEFVTDYGLTTVSMLESCFNPEMYALGSVWPFMNYMAYRGLMRAGCGELAEQIFQATVNVLNCFPGVFECYNPRDKTLGRLKDGPVCIPQMSFCAAGVVAMFLLRDKALN
jgi:hypothetical protein